MENREYLNSLFDIYKELLTSIEQETFINYYEEDLSLSEIAEIRKVSKSSVGKTLTTAEEKLKEYEKILKVYTTKERLANILELNDTSQIKDNIKKIIEEKF
ncbi:MAG: DNA-binding protein [Firmicutes bacterium]|nr:DNA-binding protein [Bacillota bacterium]